MANIWVTTIAVVLASLGLGCASDTVADTPAREGELVVNVNTATPEELETIPGIAEVLAKRIIAGRPYEQIDDLVRVQGIGEISLNAMRPYLKVDGKTEKR